MIFYHGMNKFGWDETQRQGFLLHKRASEEYPNMSPCVYLAVEREEAEKYGDVVLEVEYDPLVNKSMNNYVEGCWQVRVYEPIYKYSVIKNLFDASG